MNLIKTTEHIINLDHVSRISFSKTPDPWVTFFFPSVKAEEASRNSVKIQGAEAAELIKDLEGLQFISSGLSREAAEAEHQKKRQEKQAAFRSFGSVGKRKMILDNDKASR